jgi:type III pantothenate kinase
MRFKALNTFTSRLPLVSQKEKFELPGKNTEESIRAGVLKGILSETRGIIQEFKDKYPGIKVILCGGDSSFFETNLKESIFAVPGLVLIGLNSILLYNAAIR